MGKTADRLIFWTPRVLSILFLAFLAMFSLDIFDEGLGFWGTLLGLFMHNLPVIVLAIVLILAWKREIVGAIFYALAGLAYIGLLFSGTFHGGFQYYKISWIVMISGPAFLIAGLFYAGWLKKRKTITPKP